MDSYPEVDDGGKGISPWFRAALLDTYHKGVLFGLGFGTLMVAPEGYRFTNHKAGEKGGIRVCMIGKIPYEFIEGVNFEGDEYYNFPHIFCHFQNKGEPYEEIVFSEEVDMGHGHTYYREVAGLQDVRGNRVGWGCPIFLNKCVNGTGFPARVRLQTGSLRYRYIRML